jgi:hypothetical protein
MPWCLRGSPTIESLSGVVEGKGAFFSVDFENATDNLSPRVAEEILRAAFSRSTVIPSSIKEIAISSLRPFIAYSDVASCPMQRAAQTEWPGGQLTMGQMMGSLLSFPLLCIQTYFFYLWTMRRSLNLRTTDLREYNRCLINGDDLVCRVEDPQNFFLDLKASLKMEKERVEKCKKLAGGLRDLTLGSRFPLPVLDHVFKSMKEMRSFVMRRIEGEKKEDQVLFPAYFWRWISSFEQGRLLPGYGMMEFHPAVVNRVSRICEGNACWPSSWLGG